MIRIVSKNFESDYKLILLTQTGTNLDQGNLQRLFRRYNINKVFILRMVEENDPNFNLQPEDFKSKLDMLDRSKRDYDASINANNILLKFITILKESKIQYEYIEIKKSIDSMKIITFLIKKLSEVKQKIITDITRGERLLIPSMLQFSYYFYKNIYRITTMDFRSNEFFEFPVIPNSIDPDMKGRLTKKIIMSLFLDSKKIEYDDLVEKNNLTSKGIHDIISNKPYSDLFKEGTYGFSSVKSRLNSLSDEESENLSYLISAKNPADKRSLNYKLTSYGLLTLFIWFYSQTEVETKNLVLYKKLDEKLSEITFKDINIIECY